MSLLPRRRIPPFEAQFESGRWFVELGGVRYDVDMEKPPFDFLISYVEARLPDSWLNSQRLLQTAIQHPVVGWVDAAKDFQSSCERGENGRVLGTPNAATKAFLLFAYDLFHLDRNKLLQDEFVRRLVGDESFQGSLYEIMVAATMTRAGFRIEFENESDSSRKHPELTAVHPSLNVRIAVEAKSRHRRGVLGFRRGSPPPTLEDVSIKKVTAEVCGLAQLALPKANGLPLFVFVDLNAPPEVADAVVPNWIEQFREILPQIDTGFDHCGVRVGKIMNMLMVTNRVVQYGEQSHKGGDFLVYTLSPTDTDCQHPEASQLIPLIKQAMTNYGTVEID